MSENSYGSIAGAPPQVTPGALQEGPTQPPWPVTSSEADAPRGSHEVGSYPAVVLPRRVSQNCTSTGDKTNTQREKSFSRKWRSRKKDWQGEKAEGGPSSKNGTRDAATKSYTGASQHRKRKEMRTKQWTAQCGIRVNARESKSDCKLRRRRRKNFGGTACLPAFFWQGKNQRWNRSETIRLPREKKAPNLHKKTQPESAVKQKNDTPIDRGSLSPWATRKGETKLA